VDALLERVRARRKLPPPAERRRIREAAGVSQREMAKALGTSWTSIQRWENGSRPRGHWGRLCAAARGPATSRGGDGGSEGL